MSIYNAATMESAIAAWLTKSGLAAGRIIRKNDKLEPVPHPYITYHLPFPTRAPVGPDETRKKYKQSSDMVEITVRGQREFICGIRCYAAATVGGTDSDGNTPARDYLEKVRTAIALPSVVSDLYAAGLVFVAEEASNDLTSIMGEVGQSVAMLDMKFRLINKVTEEITWIEHVDPPVGSF